MVEKVNGFRTRGGQLIADEESALIAEAMDEIISEIPELRLIERIVQANLRRLCLHLQPLAGYYAKNHPRVLMETTLEPGLWGRTMVDGVELHPGIRFSPGRDEPEDLICDCSALMNNDDRHSPSCVTQLPKRAVAGDPFGNVENFNGVHPIATNLKPIPVQIVPPVDYI